jgi:hypothetical protein
VSVVVPRRHDAESGVRPALKAPKPKADKRNYVIITTAAMTLMVLEKGVHRTE